MERTIDRKDATLGMWYAPCCIHDLYKIQTAEDLTDARTGIPFRGVWPTLNDALLDLAQDEDEQEIATWVEWRKQFHPSDDLEIRNALGGK